MSHHLNEPLLTCEGLQIGAFTVPPFEVRRGDVVQLAFGENTFAASAAMEKLVGTFADATDHGSGPIRPLHSVAVARPAVPFRRLSTMFRRQTVCYWLARATGRTEQEVLARLLGADLDPQMLIWHAAGNPRLKLGILAALDSTAQTLVFYTAGMCDPGGRKSVLSLVFQKIDHRGAVYVSSPVDQLENEPEFARVIKVSHVANDSSNRIAG